MKAVKIKTIHSTSSKYGWSQVITWLWAWHMDSQLAVQQNRHVSANVKCATINADIPDAESIQTQSTRLKSVPRFQGLSISWNSWENRHWKFCLEWRQVMKHNQARPSIIAKPGNTAKVEEAVHMYRHHNICAPETMLLPCVWPLKKVLRAVDWASQRH